MALRPLRWRHRRPPALERSSDLDASWMLFHPHAPLPVGFGAAPGRCWRKRQGPCVPWLFGAGDDSSVRAGDFAVSCLLCHVVLFLICCLVGRGSSVRLLNGDCPALWGPSVAKLCSSIARLPQAWAARRGCADVSHHRRRGRGSPGSPSQDCCSPGPGRSPHPAGSHP